MASRTLKLTCTLNLIFSTILFECQKPQNVEKFTSHKETNEYYHSKEAKTYDLVSIELGSAIGMMDLEAEALHGKFFGERAAFYVINDPGMYMAGRAIQSINLYYLDDTLCKKKYFLEQDISHELIKSYGGFKFKTLDSISRKVLEKEPVLIRDSEVNQINPKFTKYRMTWRQDDRTLTYKYDNLYAQSYILTEELPEYKYLIRMVERFHPVENVSD